MPVLSSPPLLELVNPLHVCDAVCACWGAGLSRHEVAFEGLMLSTYSAVSGLLMKKAALWPGVIPQCLPRRNFHKAKETQFSRVEMAFLLKVV